MEINYDLCQPLNHCAVTIGSFDGVHLGHRAILDALKMQADKNNGESVVITFAPHPRLFFGKDCDTLLLLNTLDEKILLLEKAGIDRLIILTFDSVFATQTMEGFLVDYIKNTLHADTLVVGYNHRFGSDRHNDYDDLFELGVNHDVKIVRVEKHGIDERDISSTTIRNLIRMGNIDLASKYLIHPYIVIGDTDNNGVLSVTDRLKLMPTKGIYSVLVENQDNKLQTDAVITDNRIDLGCAFSDKIGVVVNFLAKK